MDGWSDGEQRDLSDKLLRKAQRYANDGHSNSQLWATLSNSVNVLPGKR